MFHFFEAITNRSGDSLIGYYGRVIDPSSNNVVTIASDDNGTPISVVSGIANMAVTDANGNLDFYVAPGTYHLDIYAPNATSLILRVKNVAMNSTKGDKGDPGTQGDTGGNVMSVGLFQDLGNTTTPAGADILRVSGYRSRGIGVFDMVYDPTINSAFVAAHPGWTRMSSNGRGYKVQSGPVQLDWFGAIPDDSQDCFPAWLAYLDLINFENRNSGSQLGAARELQAFGERYYFSDTLNFKRTITFTGAGSGQSSAAQSILRWPANKGGIIVNAYNTLGEGVQSTPTLGGDGSIIQGFSLRGGGGTANELKSGVWFRGRGVLRDCLVRTFPGHGWLVRASEASADPTIVGNANCTIIDNVRSENNVISGAKAIGADANACQFRGIDCSDNGAWGFEETSFLGNSWNVHTSNNTLGAWMSSGAVNQSRIAGYTENDQPPALKGGAVIVEGQQTAGFTTTGAGAYVSGDAANDGGGVSSDKGWYARRRRATDNMELRSRIGREDSFIDFAAYTPGGAKYEDHEITSDGQGDLFWRILGGLRNFGPTMRKKYGRPNNVENAHNVTKLFVGDGENARQIMFAPSMPTSGEFATGDFVHSTGTGVTAGKFLFGWQRQTSGSSHVLNTDWLALYATTS